MALYVFANNMFRIPISLDEVYKTTMDEILSIQVFETEKSFPFCVRGPMGSWAQGPMGPCAH